MLRDDRECVSFLGLVAPVMPHHFLYSGFGHLEGLEIRCLTLWRGHGRHAKSHLMFVIWRPEHSRRVAVLW